MSDDARTRARDRVLYQLKTRGEQTAGLLAKRLSITPMAVRQHLAALEDEELVAFRDERRKVGRPARIWRLTDEASSHFPDSHADLTVDILDAVRRTFGEEGMDKLLATRAKKLLAEYRKRVPNRDTPLAKRIAALAALRREEGYMAEWTREREGFLFVENHCPICAAAELCQGLCRDELALFRKVLGPDCRVERTDHILAGARRCAYRIESR